MTLPIVRSRCRMLEEANAKQWLMTGLIYINPDQPSLMDIYNLTETPLNRLPNRSSTTQA